MEGGGGDGWEVLRGGIVADRDCDLWPLGQDRDFGFLTQCLTPGGIDIFLGFLNVNIKHTTDLTSPQKEDCRAD